MRKWHRNIGHLSIELQDGDPHLLEILDASPCPKGFGCMLPLEVTADKDFHLKTATQFF